jgi:hypothetical protein
MTNEERDRLIDTLIERSVFLQEGLVTLQIEGMKTDRRIRRLARFVRRHEERLAEHTFDITRLDNKLYEITEKINFIIDREMKQRGLPEAGSQP